MFNSGREAAKIFDGNKNKDNNIENKANLANMFLYAFLFFIM